MKIFKFSQINIEEVKILLKVLTRKKAAKKDTIKTILLTENGDFFAKYTFDDINHSIRLSNFPKNWNKHKSYLHIKQVKVFWGKL